MGTKCFMNSASFHFGREVVSEAIALLMGIGQYFVGGTRSMPEADT